MNFFADIIQLENRCPSNPYVTTLINIKYKCRVLLFIIACVVFYTYSLIDFHSTYGSDLKRRWITRQAVIFCDNYGVIYVYNIQYLISVSAVQSLV